MTVYQLGNGTAIYSFSSRLDHFHHMTWVDLTHFQNVVWFWFIYYFATFFLFHYWGFRGGVSDFVHVDIYIWLRWSFLAAGWTCLLIVLIQSLYIWWSQRNWMWAGMPTRTKVDWCLWLLGCSAKLFMDFRYKFYFHDMLNLFELPQFIYLL